MCWTLSWTLKQVDKVMVPVLKFCWGRDRQHADRCLPMLREWRERREGETGVTLTVLFQSMV